MKKFGFMLMAAAVAAMSFTSCDNKDKDPDIVVGPDDETEVKVPTVEATVGAVTLLIKFEQAVCDGYEIRFVGDHAENAWDPATAPAMEAIGDGWYKYIIRPGKDENGVEKDAMSGRPIQCSAEVTDWGNDWSHNPEEIIDAKGVQDGMKVTNEYGETNLNFTAADAADGAVVAFVAKKWNKTPCTVFPVATAAKIKAANIFAINEEEDTKEGWQWADMEAKGNGVFTYTLTVENAENLGCNIGYEVDGDILSEWYPYEGSDFAEGDKITYTFTSEAGAKGTVTFTKAE